MDYIQVLEELEAETAVKRLGKIVALSSGEEGAPKIDVLKQEMFAIAPIVHSGTLTPEIVKKIFEAAQTMGSAPMTAIGLYSPDELHCYQVPMALAALDELRGTSCGVVNFALYGIADDGSPSWLVLFDSQLYIAYGPVPFVQALAGDIEAAYQAFRTTIKNLKAEAKGDVPGYVAQELKRVSGYLSAALAKLDTDYPKAKVGERVNVI